ncbi:hypothetical protein ABOM_002254 [Aspergillus bombycis]|uniref:Uncharacterized protein n=1 Tax=Aspergillus bombycis TaxID=109264 RepID=A0A1F8ABQ9_9EURO|nr:hypothetical protein ABOM_002254 [Aspergillus bombycis]OGM49132.1 hypothetical protein ABOM_002254 [Aspergillus bombycis]
MLPVHIILAALLSPVVAAGSVSQEQSNLLIHIPNLSRRAGGHPTTYTLDQSLLAIQIGGIVGAYVIFVAILLTLLLFVGRRLRRTVQSSNFSLQVEMMKPVKPPPSMDPSPVTPISANLPSPRMPNGFNRSWSSLGKGPRSHIANNSSVSTIDESVVALDRRRAQEEMEMLYAAVMEHDERRAAEKEATREESEIHSPDSAQSNPKDANEPEGQFSPVQNLVALPFQQQLSPRGKHRQAAYSPYSSYSSSEATNFLPGGLPGRDGIQVVWGGPASLDTAILQPTASTNTTSGDNSRHRREESVKGLAGAAPAPLSLSVAGHGSSSLPFRDAYPQQSAPATKTTVLERPLKPMNGPRTGMPTPYSPYMPFTPVTPLTPSRMVTKRQRKREAKESGLRVLNEDDVVRDNEDMWGL